MKCFPRLLICLAIVGLSPLHAQEIDEKTIAENAREILDRYHSNNPKPGERKLHIICWRPLDRPFAEDKNDRLQRILEHIQNFYADEMERHGFGRRTIQLDYDKNDQLIVHEAVGSANFTDYKKPEGDRVKNDCWPVLRAAGLDPDRETIVIFTNLSDWDPVANTFVHKSPYYARGNHRSGVAWQLESPELDVENLPLKEPIISDGEYGRISLGKHNSIFIGGIAHELGHGLGLPHCRARRDEREAHGTALMGSGNRTYFDELRGEGKGTFITLAHALRLASHPQFSGSVKGMDLPATATFSEMTVAEKAKHFVVRGKVASSIPVYAVVAYLDPEGGGDYDSRTVTTVPTVDGAFELDCFPLQEEKAAAIRVVAFMANGATSTWTSSFSVNKNGKADITLMKTTTELDDFRKLLVNRDFEAAKAIIETLPEGDQKRLAQLLLNGVQSKSRSPAPIYDLQLPLSWVKPTSEAVGWQRPAYDHLPNDQLFLISGGELFETGIYAHAPARHVYRLTGRGWNTLTGSCGLPNQNGGSVVFVIRGDGNELFRSNVLKGNEKERFEIDLTGVKTLELITEDGGDNRNQDWGLWLGVSIKP